MTDILAHDYVEQAYRQYGQHVVANRAVADYRDGLKPVQRRILWAMWRLGLRPGHTWTKSARTVGELIGRYNPHGDQSGYDALVTMVGARYPLVEGQGNFGGPRDPPASMRYTEARLSPLASVAIGPDESVMQLVPNFDGTTDEPAWMPSELPFLLLNGTSGIAVGIACEIPPHNLAEIAEAIKVAVARGPDLTVADIGCVLGPDYGAGLLVSPPADVREVYRTGQGALSFRCRYTIEPDAKAYRLVVHDLAPRFSVDRFMAQMAALQETRVIDRATDESAGETIRLVVKARDRQALVDHVVPTLDTSVSFRFFANESRADGALTFKTDLADLLRRWVQYRLGQITLTLRAAATRLDREIENLDARLMACRQVRLIAKILTESQDARTDLAAALGCTANQADHILGIPVGQLARQHADRIVQEIAERKARRDDLVARSGRPDRELVDQIDDLVVRYGQPRGTGLAHRVWVARSGRFGQVGHDRVRPDDQVIGPGAEVVQVTWSDGAKSSGPVDQMAGQADGRLAVRVRRRS
jgi:topoisomerase-4 subunit A